MATISDEWLRAYRDAILGGIGVGIFTAQGFEHVASNHWRFSPPLHGAIDFDRGADDVRRLPKVWSEGDVIHFGIDPAQPGSDRTAYWRFTR